MKQTENIMGTKKVLPLLVSMSIPPMVSMMIQALYNIVDSMYVARVSEDALTAVSLAYPLQNLRCQVAWGEERGGDGGHRSPRHCADRRAQCSFYTDWPFIGQTFYRNVH